MRDQDIRAPATAIFWRRTGRAMLGAACLALATSAAQAQTGCEGQNATTDSGSRSTDLAVRVQQETVDKAKSGAGIDPVPRFVGGTISFSHTDHDGYRLKRPIAQQDCGGAAIAPINQLLPFESEAVSASALIEWDLTKRFGLPEIYLFKSGVAVGGKHLRTEYSGTIRTPATAAFGGPANGVNVGNGNLSEHGTQFDFYSLLARGSTYGIWASSFGFGDTEIRNARFTGGQGTFGGGVGDTDFRDHSFIGIVGHVFTLGQHGSRTVQLDVSGGLLYAHYNRDGFVDTTGVRFSDAETEEFSGKLEAKLAFVHTIDAGTLTPFVKAGVKHRFDYDSTVTVTNPGTGVCIVGGAAVTPCPVPFTATFDLKSDDTFWRVGAGIAATLGGGAQTGIFEVFYDGSGDSDEIGAKAQYVVKLK